MNRRAFLQAAALLLAGGAAQRVTTRWVQPPPIDWAGRFNDVVLKKTGDVVRLLINGVDHSEDITALMVVNRFIRFTATGITINGMEMTLDEELPTDCFFGCALKLTDAPEKLPNILKIDDHIYLSDK